MCFVDMGKSLVVLDAGPTYEFAKEFYGLMKKEYPHKKVSAVVLSNFHDDRILGASFFQKKGAKIIGYKNINDDIKTYTSKISEEKSDIAIYIPKDSFLFVGNMVLTTEC